MFGFKLVPDAKYWHSLWSIQLAILGGLFTGLWAALPAFQGYLPPEWFAVCCVGISIGGVLCRLVDQPNVPTS